MQSDCTAASSAAASQLQPSAIHHRRDCLIDLLCPLGRGECHQPAAVAKCDRLCQSQLTAAVTAAGTAWATATVSVAPSAAGAAVRPLGAPDMWGMLLRRAGSRALQSGHRDKRVLGAAAGTASTTWTSGARMWRVPAGRCSRPCRVCTATGRAWRARSMSCSAKPRTASAAWAAAAAGMRRLGRGRAGAGVLG